MPLYEYRCAHCDGRFEVLQRVGEGADGVTCPACGRPHPERQFSTFAATLGTSGGAESGTCSTGGCCGGFGCAN